MPFISGFSPEGGTFGQIIRQEERDKEEARRKSWEKSEAYTAFNANDFVSKINTYLEEKKKEYHAVKAGFFGLFRAVLTRYKEKDEFLNSKIEPLLRECKKNPSAENKQNLVRELRAGIERFTTFEKQSGITKILEAALFALTDNQLAKKADFNFFEADQEKAPVVASVARDKRHGGVVVGTVVPNTRDEDDLRILSQVHVPSTLIGLFNRVQPATFTYRLGDEALDDGALDDEAQVSA